MLNKYLLNKIPLNNEGEKKKKTSLKTKQKLSEDGGLGATVGRSSG